MSDAWIARDAPWLGLDDGAARGLLAPLLVAYREPHRFYHDVRHLREMLEAVHALRSCCRDFRAVLLAAWFHDGVYRPEQHDNEARSAAWAEQALTATRFSKEVVGAVRELVLSTSPAAPLPADVDAQVLFDADRRIWAAAPERYAEYARGIRAEYGHYTWLSYSRGRARFLGKALRAAVETERLFFHLGSKEEESARVNLARELRCLWLPRVLVARLFGRDPLAILQSG